MSDEINIKIEAYKERIETQPGKYENTGKWIGVVLIEDEPRIWSPARNTEEKAKYHARRCFFNALDCSHTFQYSHDDMEQDRAGNEYRVNVYECKTCGLRLNFEPLESA